MNLLHDVVPLPIALLGWVALLPSLLLAWRQVRRASLGAELVQHVWLGGAVCVALLWLLTIKVGNCPAFGMLGVGLYSLVFGRARALLGLTFAVILHTACTHGAWLNIGLNGVLFALVPSIVATFCQRWIESRLPHHLFVFIFGNGMLSSFVCTAATSMLLFLVSSAVESSWTCTDFGQYLGPIFLLGWSEAIVSGMLFSSLVIFAPEVVLTSTQDRYLPRARVSPR